MGSYAVVRGWSARRSATQRTAQGATLYLGETCGAKTPMVQRVGRALRREGRAQVVCRPVCDVRRGRGVPSVLRVRRREL